MKNIRKIANYISSGEKKQKKLGVELEHFVCDADGGLISYDDLSRILLKIGNECCGELFWEAGNLLGMRGDNYSISLEPAGQLEISINPFAEIEEIETVYQNFRKIWDAELSREGYHFVQRGVFPTVESGEQSPEEFPLIPKQRYHYMNQYFETSGSYGKHMMRATASTQISVDYSSQEDCMRKLRILEIISPLLSLLMENHSGLGVSKEWQPHLLRTQIWNGVDQDRCGYIPGSLEAGFSYEKYADYVYNRPFILLSDKDEVIEVGKQSAAQFLDGQEIFFEEHLLTMFFNHIRLKKYLEIRVADSVSQKKMTGFIALIKGLIYSEDSLEELDALFGGIKTIEQIKAAEAAIMADGYGAEVYESTAVEQLCRLYQIAFRNLNEKDRKYLSRVLTLPMLEYLYTKDITKDFKLHSESAEKDKEYIRNSTAKYHERVVRTMYVPKIFTQNDIDIFRQLIEQLYKIFDKVYEEYKSNEAYRKLFGFDAGIEELILREKTYSCNIPIARIDIFYDEQLKTFRFCEFNTDGTSAMNEDRELNHALKLTKAYESFSRDFNIKTFELFDSWIDEFLIIYGEFAQKYAKSGTPNVAIVDFLENATINEFEIFRQRFTDRGIACEICDIRELKWDGEKCVTPGGMQVDAIYRRAVTSDILKHYGEVGDAIEAVKNNAVCLIGEFRTQIAHNKILYKVLHMPETQRLLTKEERRYVKAHVPYTVSLESKTLDNNIELKESVFRDKNRWIIKPEDSYGSWGVHAGVECNDSEWKEYLEKCIDHHYILQEFCTPYQLYNIDLCGPNPSPADWKKTSNLTGLFVYNGKVKGIYSRISYDEMISTQYNEMAIPTIVVDLG